MKERIRCQERLRHQHPLRVCHPPAIATAAAAVSVCETALNPIKVNNLDQLSLNIFQRTLNP